MCTTATKVPESSPVPFNEQQRGQSQGQSLGTVPRDSPLPGRPEGRPLHRVSGQCTGAGSSELPIRYASTPRAQLRPSAIAHTMSDWPRCMSPAVNTPSTLVSIFLSPFDVHINRSPIAGEVLDIRYSRGKFLMATNNNASLINEQNTITIEGSRVTIVCKQIAGILARRIVCWKSKGDHVTLGERFGLIKFSSRTDLILPENVEVLVTKGMHVRGGVTIVGRIR